MITAIYIIAFCFIIYKIKFLHSDFGNQKVAIFVFLLKITAGIFIYWIYTYYYPDRSKADIYRYYDDSLGLYNLFNENPKAFFSNFFGFTNDFDYGGKYFDRMNNWVYPNSRILHDNRLIIRINTVLRFLCGTDFFAHFVWFNFVSFIGSTLMLKSIDKIDLNPTLKIAAFFLIPSFWVWSSGLLKEPLIILALGIIFYQLSKFKTYSLKYLVLMFFAILILIFTKTYLLVCLIPGLIFFYVYHFFRLSMLKTLLITQIPIIAFVLTSNLFSPIDIFDIIYTKRLIFISVANSESSGSYINNIILEPNVFNFVENLPKVMFNVFLKPLPFEAKSLPELLYSLENIFFSVLSFVVIFLIIKYKMKFEVLKKNPILVCTLIFGVYLFLIIGYTTPVYGAITRYKCIALPYYLILLFSFIDKLKPK